MEIELDRAERILLELKGEHFKPSSELCQEIAGLLAKLVKAVHSQQHKLSAAVLALNYYRDPSLYALREQLDGTPLLDEGLRARTALGVISGATKHPLPVRIPLPDAG